MNHLKTITLVATLAACSSSPKDTGDTGATGPTPAASTSAGGCDWMGSFCYDFDGPAWDAASAEAGCDAFTDAAVSEGAPLPTFVATGCPSGAVAQCTGFSYDPTDPGTAFTLYYYDATILPEFQAGCTDGGGTWSDL